MEKKEDPNIKKSGFIAPPKSKMHILDHVKSLNQRYQNEENIDATKSD